MTGYLRVDVRVIRRGAIRDRAKGYWGEGSLCHTLSDQGFWVGLGCGGLFSVSSQSVLMMAALYMGKWVDINLSSRAGKALDSSMDD